ncbi:MAG TPA: lipocalin family protein [Bacteroidales bacterium]|nr:lipocalin family protein [Bacteroidales bacterium]HPS17946.1 lipocalin family protein [Bacteroidales bacterium]
MKKAIYLLFAALIILAAGCGKSTKDKVVGVWKLKSVQGETLAPQDLQTTITFGTDGKLEMKAAENNGKIGTWALSKDEKSVEAISSEGGDKETWNIKSIDEKEFVFTVNTDTVKITLEKQLEK